MALFVYWVIPKQDSCPKGYEVCCRLLPEDRRIGVDFAIGGDRIGEVGIKGGVDRSNSPTGPQLEAYMQCIGEVAKQRGDEVKLINIVRIPQEPIGQVRDMWAAEQDGPKLQWIRSYDPLLSLIRIGDDVGTKANVIGRWCRENALCVDCSTLR